MSQPRQVLKTTNFRVLWVLTQLRHATYGEHMTELLTHQQGVIPPWTQGWRLQRSLAHAGMTTEDMADELGVARSTVSRWCNDKGRPTKGYLKLWALRTGVSMDWLTESKLDIPARNNLSAGIPVQPATPGHAIIDNDITRRMRKRIPLNPALALVLRMAS
jgi:transcriptional regulator with XRE-family HTH domain